MTVVAGGIMAVDPNITGMLIKGIHLTVGKALCANHTITGAADPPKKNQFNWEYTPSLPKILLGPAKPHMTDALKNTWSPGHVHGLFAAKRLVWHISFMSSLLEY